MPGLSPKTSVARSNSRFDLLLLEKKAITLQAPALYFLDKILLEKGKTLRTLQMRLGSFQSSHFEG